MLKTTLLSKEWAAAWGELFRRSECPCYCRWWHFTGDKNAWLERCATDPEENFREQTSLLGTEEGSAVIAIEDERVVGHMKLAPRALLPKLRKRPVYASLDLGSEDGVWSIGCFLVDPEFRGRDVPRALVRFGIEHLRQRKARAIEAYPFTAETHTSQAWMGREKLFHELGFTRAAGEDPYPVLRLVL